MSPSPLLHRQIDVAGLSTHIVEGGAEHQRAMLFVHGWPEDCYFYDLLQGPAGVSRAARDAFVRAYARPAALHAGFEWYHAFPRDVQDNQASRTDVVEIPVLCLRGDHDSGDLDRYVQGLRASGLRHVHGQSIEKAGHFLPIEQPAAVAAALRAFVARGATATSGA